MKIISNQQLPNGIGLSILELDNSIIKTSFEDRFQVMVEIGGNRLLPKSKKKFLDFKDKNYLYFLNPEKGDMTIEVEPEIYYEKELCDRSWDDCIKIVMEYIGMYNEGKNLREEIVKEFIMIN
jgi:hypothetical protein